MGGFSLLLKIILKIMFSFFKKKLALLWAKKEILKSKKFKDNASEDQKNLLLSLVKTAEKTLFGRIHQFDEIQSIKNFQEKVPIVDYESIKPFIDKIKHGDRHILYPDIPLYFAKTSGNLSSSLESTSARAINSGLPPSIISVPLPAIFVAIVTALYLPA